jgi:hypothetical protein
MVEGALAAHGYRIELPRQQSAGTSAMTMTQGLATILLAETRQSELAEVEVYGAARSAAVALLDTLPIGLHKLASGSMQLRELSRGSSQE